MLSLGDLTDPPDPLLRVLGPRIPPATADRLVLMRGAEVPRDAAGTLVVAPAAASWSEQPPAALGAVAAVVLVGQDPAAVQLASSSDVAVLVPEAAYASGELLELWALIHERVAAAASAEIERHRRLAAAGREGGAGTVGIEAVMSFLTDELGARARLVPAGAQVPDLAGDWPEVEALARDVPGPLRIPLDGFGHAVAVAAGPKDPPPILLVHRPEPWGARDLSLVERAADRIGQMSWAADLGAEAMRLAESTQALRASALDRLMAGDLTGADRALQPLVPGLVGVGSGEVAVIECAPHEGPVTLTTSVERALDRAGGLRALVVSESDWRPTGPGRLASRAVVVVLPKGRLRLSDLLRAEVQRVRGRVAGISPITPWPRAAAAYQAAVAALAAARAGTASVVVHDGRAPLTERLGEDARIWAALVMEKFTAQVPDTAKRNEILQFAQQALWLGDSVAARRMGWHRQTLIRRLKTLTDATGLQRSDLWQGAALYLAVRLSMMPAPVVLNRRVRLHSVLNHDNARDWATSTLAPLETSERAALSAWLACYPDASRATEQLSTALGRSVGRTAMYELLAGASKATGLTFTTHPGHRYEAALALHIAGDLPMSALPEPSPSATPTAEESMPSRHPVEVEISDKEPQTARIYDYFLGGTHNFEVDRQAAARIEEINPHTGFACRQCRSWVNRATEFVVGSGITQILDIGSGIPTSPNVHETAQELDRRARVLYVDKDPVVREHIHDVLRRSTEEGSAQYLHADFFDGAALLDRPEVHATLDLGRPVALFLNSLLHFMPDEGAYDVVAALVARLAPGSMLAMVHLAPDFAPDLIGRVIDVINSQKITAKARNRDEFARFFAGLELVGDDIACPPAWRTRDNDVIPDFARVNAWCAIGRVPL